MQTVRIPFQNIPQLSKKDIAYATENPSLRPFFKYDVKIESFGQIITDKQKENTDRQVLVDALLKQYSQMNPHQRVKENIQSLARENTFTVTTAHQPALFTGPLYYTYKIISTIRLAEELNRFYPDYHFVPVFVSGAEDHDFEEINHANLFQKHIVWENNEKGAVGMMKTHTLKNPLAELKEILGESEQAKSMLNIFSTACAFNETYGEATIQVINELYESYGLVVLDMNKPALKRLFIPIAEQELLHQVSQPMIEAAQEKLEAAGFGGQAHARDINLFYLSDQIRNRIVFEDDLYKVVETELVFSAKEILEELHNHPERFSPNVVLRPLYQELILPNLAYIGGGGEIAYWLERLKQFEHFGINFPMLVRRNSVLWIDKNSQKKIEKLGFNAETLFNDTDWLIRTYVDHNASSPLSLEEEKKLLEAVFEGILKKTEEVDPSLQKAVLAEQTRQLKTIDQLESRLHRAEKQKHDTAINQIRSLKEKFFPNNGLQERTDNFLPYYLKYGEAYFDLLKAELDPLEQGFIVFIED
ncbi:MAG: bacillithiol biosynthesis cysteine-adding enzyme BshC [Saprospiraceae bacterium]|nr:bacillithiol biosynthesis cysteine-adding enzyme BshC [Saprospiraceae bacterium]MCB9325543.1 bacillithiol biosynthesis cysteine-adding enzyme BshC [Lewinellaceae bacterium]